MGIVGLVHIEHYGVTGAPGKVNVINFGRAAPTKITQPVSCCTGIIKLAGI